MQPLTSMQARRARWTNHLLGGSDLSPAQVVDRAVALQGQDLPAVLRAIALRSRAGTTVDDVRAAFDRGELVRSWPVRGTLFATTPSHLRNLLSLTGERIHRSTARRREQLGLDDATLERAREIALPLLPPGVDIVALHEPVMRTVSTAHRSAGTPRASIHLFIDAVRTAAAEQGLGASASLPLPESR